MERASISSINSDDNSLKNDTKQRVIVTHIESPECFYVQLVKSKSQLNNLNSMLKNYMRDNPPIVKKPEESKYIRNFFCYILCN